MKRIWTGIFATAFVSVASAQSPTLQPKLAELQPEKFAVPLCPLRPAGNINKGVDALKKAHDAKADKAAELTKAKDILVKSITSEDQGENAAAWYYLARVYLMQGDVMGVDSAFTKAETLQPQCEIDISQYRQNGWAQLANAGLELQRENKIDEAMVLFRDADVLFDDLPHVAANLGVLYANVGKDDSAATYFAKALKIAETNAESDTTAIGDRNSNALNLALMQQRLGRHQDAIGTLTKYLGWEPTNVDARKALAQSYRGAGQTAQADSIERAMLTELSKQNLDSLETGDILSIGVAAFNAQDFQRAAEAFDKAVSRNPYSRDAIYNLANAYLALKDNAKLVETSKKLVAIEPMNEDVYRLLGQGHRGLEQQDEMLKAAEALIGLPVTIDVTAFQIGRTSSRLEGVATGRAPTDAQGKALKAAPVTVVIEFVTAAGAVVGSQDVAIPLLEAGATHKFTAEASGADVAGWRYKKK
ncbi:MAG: tetratricopeptide repeat protein [Gemmatimonadales bacterium]